MKEFLNRFNLTLIIVTYSAILLSLYEQLHWIVMLLGSVCAAWRTAHYYGKAVLIPRLLLSIVAITSSIIVVLLIYPLGVFNVMLHLIFLGFSLKFLELRSLRDVTFFVNTGFVLLALFFIFNTSIVATIIAICLLLLLLATLLSLHAQMMLNKRFLGVLLKSCLLSLPLALVLFVVLPRLPSLWKMPIQQQATTGLSDSVSPGEIAKLSQSSALAFRATFTGEVAPESERYWRAMTLDNFDGKTWAQSTLLKKQESDAKRGGGLRFSLANGSNQGSQNNNAYELIIEPHFNYWVPVLDYAQTPQGLISLEDYSLRSEQPIIARKSFSVMQMKQVNHGTLSPLQKQQYTQLPNTGNEQTDQWIVNNLQNGLSKQNILKQLLHGFTQTFRYTLEPPLLGDKQIDDFLFKTQAGFCVHYASSYLYVARRLGIPARMVTGYLGGEWQASEGFFTVRQYDAHAWVEVWVGNQWKRVDPTAHVAPERVESGLEASLSDASEFLADEYFSLQRWQSIELVNQLRGRLAQLDYLWARYVVNFDNQKQMKLVQRWLEHIPWLNLAYLLLIVMMMIFVMLLLVIFKPWQTNKVSPEDNIYLQLQSYFKKQGINRQAQQTVTEYCHLVSQHDSSKAVLLKSFAARYNALKYQPQLSNEQYKKHLKQLKYITKQLKRGDFRISRL